VQLPPKPVRVVVLVIIAATVLCSCTGTTRTGPGGPGSGLPRFSSVVGGRFVSQVKLDDGGLVVDPGGAMRPRVPVNVADAMFRAADVVRGAHRFSVFGLGVVTVSPQVPLATTTAPDTTATTPTPTTGSGTTLPSATTTTTGASSTATAPGGATGTSTSAAPTTGATPPAAAPPPMYQGRLAWVGIAWDVACPRVPNRSPNATRYVAVVFDAQTGRSALAYTSRSAATCNGPIRSASVSRPDELVSIAWQPVGPTSTAVRVTMPPCGSFYGWTEVATSGTNSIQVVARVPFDPVCGSKVPVTETVDNVVPLGKSQTALPHAAIGPVDALRTLPGG
jgi:hypothetical protein